MKQYKYILLDFDGCVAKTLNLWLEAYKEVFAKYGISLSDREIGQKVFGDWQGPKKVGVKDNDEFIKILIDKVDSRYPDVGLYDNVLETITKLKMSGRKLALLTSSKRELVTKALVNNKMLGYFDLLLAAEDVSKHKPDPEMIDKALDSLQGIKEQAIIVGDSKSDLGAATNAGIDSILFYPKENEVFYDLDFLKSFKPSHIVKDFQEILDIIQ